MNNIMQADSHDVTMTLRRTYGMVISSYENVARKDQLTLMPRNNWGGRSAAELRN